MGGLYSHTTRATGTVLTAAIYNGDHQNHIDNLLPSMIDDQSANTAAMQATTNPGGVGTESLATNLQGELERLRYVIKTMHGGAQWYPGSALLSSGTLTTRGDLLTRDASTAVRLAVGGANRVLKSDGTDPSWAYVAGTMIRLGSDAQGDVMYFNGTDWARLGAGTDGQFLRTQGAAANPTWSSRVISSAVTSLSGTAGVTWGSIPSWVTNIVVNIALASVDDTDNITLRIGPSGGIETTGYVSSAASGAIGYTDYTNGFTLRSATATDSHSGLWHVTRIGDGNIWSAVFSFRYASASQTWGAGHISLSGALTQVQLCDTGGDNFDAGSAAMMYW